LEGNVLDVLLAAALASPIGAALGHKLAKWRCARDDEARKAMAVAVLEYRNIRPDTDIAALAAHRGVRADYLTYALANIPEDVLRADEAAANIAAYTRQAVKAAEARCAESIRRWQQQSQVIDVDDYTVAEEDNLTDEELAARVYDETLQMFRAREDALTDEQRNYYRTGVPYDPGDRNLN
jgi:hypothetical protein